MISVVVPMEREVEGLDAFVRQLLSLSRCRQLVLVASTQPAPVSKVDDPRVCVVRAASSGRGAALVQGAAVATGDVLLFVHADARLPHDATEQILEVLADPRVAGGWFRRRLDDPRWRFRAVDLGANTFSRCCRIATGDQAIFCRRSAFLQVDGVQDYPLFEDMTLCRRLKPLGRLVQLPGPVVVSPRRFYQRGLVATVTTNIRLTWAYFRGDDPALLFRKYYGSASGHTTDAG